MNNYGVRKRTDQKCAPNGFERSTLYHLKLFVKKSRQFHLISRSASVATALALTLPRRVHTLKGEAVGFLTFPPGEGAPVRTSGADEVSARRRVPCPPELRRFHQFAQARRGKGAGYYKKLQIITFSLFRVDITKIRAIM